jgi:hypothetical protein
MHNPIHISINTSILLPQDAPGAASLEPVCASDCALECGQNRIAECTRRCHAPCFDLERAQASVVVEGWWWRGGGGGSIWGVGVVGIGGVRYGARTDAKPRAVGSRLSEGDGA